MAICAQNQERRDKKRKGVHFSIGWKENESVCLQSENGLPATELGLRTRFICKATQKAECEAKL